jgi:hypothetical protein
VLAFPVSLRVNFLEGEKMKKFVLLLAMLSIAGVAGATVVNFDDLPTSQPWAAPYGNMSWDVIPATYQGLNWTPNGDSGWNVNSGTTYQSAFGNSYGAVSADNFASNSGLAVATVDGTTFDFAGAYFSTWAQNNGFASFAGGYSSATSVTVNGYNGATLVGTVNMNLSSTGFDWLTANFVGVNKLEISSNSSQGYWIMDNFTYTPEPMTLALLGLGALALRRKKA